MTTSTLKVRQWRKKNPKRYKENGRRWFEKNRRYDRLRRHSLTQEQYDNKMQEQDSRCAVCRKEFTGTPHVDHNHQCCPIRRSCDKCRRGLLCEDCNLGLGRFKDSITSLSNAIEYLKGYQK